jgi:protein-S-isoprenylcysteine O-methyltransferase Ste14
VINRPAAILEIIWLVWLCSWVAASFWSGRTQTRIATLESWTYRAAMIVGGLLIGPWTPRLLAEKPLWHVSFGSACVLAAVMLVGLGFTWWARIYLGRLWSSVISRKEDHRIIDTGPYGLVRHPIYTGLILALVATGIAEATVTALIGAALLILGVWMKASSEERFLRAELGPQYDAYSRRVPMLIPFLPHH